MQKYQRIFAAAAADGHDDARRAPVAAGDASAHVRPGEDRALRGARHAQPLLARELGRCVHRSMQLIDCAIKGSLQPYIF